MTNDIWARKLVWSRVVQLIGFGSILAVGLPIASAAPATNPLHDCGASFGQTCHTVLQSAAEVAIERSDLEAVFGGNIESVAGPSFGQLRFAPPYGAWHTVYFEPAVDFWSVGLDRLTVWTSLGAKTVLMVAADHRDTVVTDSFESNAPPTHDPDTRFKPSPEAAFEGAQGLRLSPGDADAWVHADTLRLGEGEGQQGQHTEVGICPPEGVGPDTGPAPTLGGPSGEGYGPTFTILEGWTSAAGAYEVSMRHNPDPGQFDIGVRLLGGAATLTKEWTTIPGGPHRLTAHAWTVEDQAGGHHRAGVHLLVDDRLVQTVAATVAEEMVTQSIRLGMVSTPTAAPIIDYDALTTSGGYASRGIIPVRADDFEDGSLDDWLVYMPSAVKLASASDDGGVGGEAHVAFELPVPALLIDNRPAADERIALRFGLDASGVHGPTGSALKIVDVRSGDDYQGGARHLKLSVVLDANGARSLVLRTLGAPANGGWVVSAPVALPAGSSAVVVEWRRAYDLANTGYVRLWVNGELETELSGLANQDHAWGSYRVGVINSPAGLYGSLGVDNLVVWEPTSASTP